MEVAVPSAAARCSLERRPSVRLTPPWSSGFRKLSSCSLFSVVCGIYRQSSYQVRGYSTLILMVLTRYNRPWPSFSSASSAGFAFIVGVGSGAAGVTSKSARKSGRICSRRAMAGRRKNRFIPNFWARYTAYLKSPQWKAIRKLLIKKHGGRCQRCGSTYRLEAHHITYKSVFEEKLTDLRLLCHVCHEKVERGKKRRREMRLVRMDFPRVPAIEMPATDREAADLLQSWRP